MCVCICVYLSTKSSEIYMVASWVSGVTETLMQRNTEDNSFV